VKKNISMISHFCIHAVGAAERRRNGFEFCIGIGHDLAEEIWAFVA
jgi:hypothetical protein